MPPPVPAPFAKLSTLAVTAGDPALAELAEAKPPVCDLNSEFLQCAAFLQAQPELVVPLHVLEYAQFYRSVEAEAFISAAEGHEIIETESAPQARARI